MLASEVRLGLEACISNKWGIRLNPRVHPKAQKRVLVPWCVLLLEGVGYELRPLALCET